MKTGYLYNKMTGYISYPTFGTYSAENLPDNFIESEKLEWVQNHRHQVIGKGGGKPTIEFVELPKQDLPKRELTLEQKQEQIRSKRNSLIFETDKYLLPDFPVYEEDLEKIKKYRTALRDITKQKIFKKSGEVEWPEFPL